MQTSTSEQTPRPPDGRPPEWGRAPDPELALQAAGIGKDYRNPWTLRVTRALEGLVLEVRRREVIGLLGPNGAGKTTALKILTGLLKPSRGRAWLFGEPIERTASRRRLGFLPEQPYFYDYLTGPEYLELVGRLSGLPAVQAGRRSRHWLARGGLGERPRLVLRKYSKGMLQRLGLAAALVHEPELLILDEPMSGLDPFGRREVRDLILEQRERGATVVFSSHVLPDVEMLCDRVAILRDGRLNCVAEVGDLVHDGRHAVEIRCTEVSVVALPVEWSRVLSRREQAHETVFVLEREELLPEVLRWLLAGGIRVRAVTPQRASLEDLFLSSAGGPDWTAAPADARPA